ncbi:hypothetical protein Hanom_Chr07g00615291 [Helianthus anomalus]
MMMSFIDFVPILVDLLTDEALVGRFVDLCVDVVAGLIIHR